MILLGGQPGAGKTRAADAVLSGGRPGGYRGVVAIVGDDYRKFHPDYRRLITEDPLAMPDVTAPAAGAWTGMAVAHALEHGYSILIEGTWRNAQVPMRSIDLATEHGFEVHAYAIAVPAHISRLSTLERYYRDVDQGNPARWTPLDAHEEAIANAPATAALIGAVEAVTRLATVDRSGAFPFTSTNPASPARGSEFGREVKTAITAALDRSQARSWLNDFDRLHRMHLQHSADESAAQATWALLASHKPIIDAMEATALTNTGQRALRPGPTAQSAPVRPQQGGPGGPGGPVRGGFEL